MDLKLCHVLVTATSYGKTDDRLFTELEGQVGKVVYNTTGKPLPAAEVARLLPGMDGYIAGLDVINRQALATADRLKVIARYGVGVDNIDLAAASERGIRVTNTPGANSISVAELTVGLILSLARKIPESAAAARTGGWPRTTGLSLEGKTVGLLGLGLAGRDYDLRSLARRCAVDSLLQLQGKDQHESRGGSSPAPAVGASSQFPHLAGGQLHDAQPDLPLPLVAGK